MQTPIFVKFIFSRFKLKSRTHIKQWLIKREKKSYREIILSSKSKRTFLCRYCFHRRKTKVNSNNRQLNEIIMQVLLQQNSIKSSVSLSLYIFQLSNIIGILITYFLFLSQIKKKAEKGDNEETAVTQSFFYEFYLKENRFYMIHFKVPITSLSNYLLLQC